MTKPPTNPNIPTVDEKKVGARPQDIVLQTQKLVKAGQISLAKGTLQDDQIQFLTTINDEAKVRRKTKSLILGTARAMSYEDLEEARVKRAEKDTAKEPKGKRKRSRKRRSTTPAADAATPVEAKRGRKRKSDLPEADAPKPSNHVGADEQSALARVSQSLSGADH